MFALKASTENNKHASQKETMRIDFGIPLLKINVYFILQFGCNKETYYWETSDVGP